MFRKLRIQFILIATLAVTFVLISIIGVLNASRYAMGEKRIDKILDLLSENGGELPNADIIEEHLGKKINPDIMFQYRYFSAYINDYNTVVTLNVEHIANLTETDVIYYIDKIISSNHTYGNFTTTDGQIFAYKLTVNNENSNKLIVVLDSTSYFEERADLIQTSMMLFFVNLTFFIFVFVVFSGKVIKPFIENYQNQRAFITNASHELKTPLAIISANNELAEMVNGENEWTVSTKEQIERLTELINRLVVLAKFEEQTKVAAVNISFSEIVEKAARSFTSIAIKSGKIFETDIGSDIYINGDEKAVYELVNILIDNANKYCDANGRIGIRLRQSGRTFKKARLEVYNTYKGGKNIDYSKFFDRFYREDKSHNSSVAGYGVGLSIAENIVKRHRGKINISYRDDTIYFNIYFNIVDKQK